MKFLKRNQEKKGCALVAAHNASLWYGNSIPYDKISEISRVWYGFNNATGFKANKLTGFLKDINLPIKRLNKNTKISSVLCSLWEGNSVILSYYPDKSIEGHVVFVTPKFKVFNNHYKNWVQLYNAICKNKIKFAGAWVINKP